MAALEFAGQKKRRKNYKATKSHGCTRQAGHQFWTVLKHDFRDKTKRLIGPSLTWSEAVKALTLSQVRAWVSFSRTESSARNNANASATSLISRSTQLVVVDVYNAASEQAGSGSSCYNHDCRPGTPCCRPLVDCSLVSNLVVDLH